MPWGIPGIPLHDAVVCPASAVDVGGRVLGGERVSLQLEDFNPPLLPSQVSEDAGLDGGLVPLAVDPPAGNLEAFSQIGELGDVPGAGPHRGDAAGVHTTSASAGTCTVQLTHLVPGV